MALAENTKSKALNEGRTLLQKFGYNGFSFQHIANALGLRKQSLFVHFRSKEALGVDLIETYFRNFTVWTETIAICGPEEKIKAWFERFYVFIADDLKYCPLVALASDYHSLPKAMRKKLHQTYDMRLAWIVGVIEEGQQKKNISEGLESRAPSQNDSGLRTGVATCGPSGERCGNGPRGG